MSEGNHVSQSASPDMPDFVPQGVVVNRLMPGRANLPEKLQGKIILSDWADALVNHTAYKEVDPDYLSRMLLVQTLTAQTPEEVFEQSGIRKLQELVPNAPGLGTGVVEIADLYVTSSDFGEGAPCYMIVDIVDETTGDAIRFSTGATQLQAQIIALLSFGTWPIRCQIKRTERKDRGGRFLFWLFPPE